MGAEDDDSDIAPVLPNLQIIDRERREREASTSTDGIVAGLDCRFCQDAEFAREWLLAGPSGGRRKTRDPRSTPVLLSSYFRWLSWLLKNASQWCVSLRLGRLLGGRRHLWSNGKLWRLSVEDPFEAYNSLVRVHMSLARVFICRHSFVVQQSRPINYPAVFFFDRAETARSGPSGHYAGAAKAARRSECRSRSSFDPSRGDAYSG